MWHAVTQSLIYYTSWKKTGIRCSCSDISYRGLDVSHYPHMFVYFTRFRNFLGFILIVLSSRSVYKHCNKTVALKQKESQNVFRFIKISPCIHAGLRKGKSDTWLMALTRYWHYVVWKDEV